MLTAFRKNVAYHEAGHAVAACRLLFGFHYAKVLPRGQSTHVDRRGRERVCSGTVDCGSFDVPLFYPAMSELRDEQRAPIFDQGFRHMIVDLAGPYSEARYSKQGSFTVALIGGGGDWKNAKRTAAYLAGENAGELLKLADRWAGRLVRENWSSVRAVAEKLSAVGEILIDDDTVAGIERVDEQLLDVSWTPTGITWKEVSAA